MFRLIEAMHGRLYTLDPSRCEYLNYRPGRIYYLVTRYDNSCYGGNFLVRSIDKDAVSYIFIDRFEGTQWHYWRPND